jgi:hypothetical protein
MAALTETGRTKAQEESEEIAQRIEREFPGWKVEAYRSELGEWYLDGEDAEGVVGFFVPVAQVRGRKHLQRALHGLGTAPGSAR